MSISLCINQQLTWNMTIFIVSKYIVSVFIFIYKTCKSSCTHDYMGYWNYDHIRPTYILRTSHLLPTYISRTFHVNLTNSLPIYYVHLTYTSRTSYVNLTYTSRTHYVNPTYIFRIPQVHLTYILRTPYAHPTCLHNEYVILKSVLLYHTTCIEWTLVIRPCMTLHYITVT